MNNLKFKDDGFNIQHANVKDGQYVAYNEKSNLCFVIREYDIRFFKMENNKRVGGIVFEINTAPNNPRIVLPYLSFGKYPL